MLIRNASVYTEDGTFVPGDIFIQGKFFAASRDAGMGDFLEDAGTEDMVIDGSGCYAVPGLTDIHFHGCAGYDFSDGSEEALKAMAQYEASVGVTGMVPTAMTLGEEELFAVCRAAEAYNRSAGAGQLSDMYAPGTESGGRARLYGIRMEGPFLSHGKKGAQNEAYLRTPDIARYDRLQKASGNLIKLLDIAPEIDGAMELIGRLSGETMISLAHTEADYETAMKAFAKGASHVTHLYNAMNGYTHREPGLIGAAADYESVGVELICDGV
ncbi:MAG: N-acetylglucosamine-6-phosphate deacetylase, partial [Acetatifactor sp.]|nr:N-acetylglucosamine-6-phosphate deacetylase [Acetatifactor sp.]